ncbi:amino acid ABC transporter permease [soil metagenome]
MNPISFLIDNWDLYINGFIRLFQAANLAFVFAMIVGVIIASFRVSPIPPLQKFAAFYVTVFRNTPLLIVFFLFFFGLPKLGFTFTPFMSTVIVMSLYTGAYLSETVRSGINSVDTGQAEAARAIGLKFREVLGSVVIPQALRTVVGPIGNLYIANGKNTVIGTTIGLFVETTAAQRLANSTGQPIAAYAAAAIFFVVWLLIAAQVFTSIEHRVAIKR